MNRELLKAIEDGDVVTIKEHFDAKIASQLNENINEIKKELAKELFKTGQQVLDISSIISVLKSANARTASMDVSWLSIPISGALKNSGNSAMSH